MNRFQKCPPGTSLNISLLKCEVPPEGSFVAQFGNSFYHSLSKNELDFWKASLKRYLQTPVLRYEGSIPVTIQPETKIERKVINGVRFIGERLNEIVFNVQKGNPMSYKGVSLSDVSEKLLGKELQELAKKVGVPTYGTKAALVQRIRNKIVESGPLKDEDEDNIDDEDEEDDEDEDEPDDEKSLQGYKVSDVKASFLKKKLQDIAEDLGLSTSGTKDVIIGRIHKEIEKKGRIPSPKRPSPPKRMPSPTSTPEDERPARSERKIPSRSPSPTATPERKRESPPKRKSPGKWKGVSLEDVRKMTVAKMKETAKLFGITVKGLKADIQKTLEAEIRKNASSGSPRTSKYVEDDDDKKFELGPARTSEKNLMGVTIADLNSMTIAKMKETAKLFGVKLGVTLKAQILEKLTSEIRERGGSKSKKEKRASPKRDDEKRMSPRKEESKKEDPKKGPRRAPKKETMVPPEEDEDLKKRIRERIEKCVGLIAF